MSQKGQGNGPDSSNATRKFVTSQSYTAQDLPGAAKPKTGQGSRPDPRGNRASLRRPSDQDDSESCTHVVWGGVERMSSNSSDQAQSQGSCVETQKEADRPAGLFSGVVLRSSSPSSNSDRCVEAAMNSKGYPEGTAAGNMMMYNKASGPDMVALLDEVESTQVTAPADQRSGSWSAGAVLHASGDCKPCARSWKPKGCVQGASCPCCHLCGIDEFKRYRKNRLAGLRANRAKRKNKNGATDDPPQAMSYPGSSSLSF